MSPARACACREVASTLCSMIRTLMRTASIAAIGSATLLKRQVVGATGDGVSSAMDVTTSGHATRSHAGGADGAVGAGGVSDGRAAGVGPRMSSSSVNRKRSRAEVAGAAEASTSVSRSVHSQPTALNVQRIMTALRSSKAPSTVQTYLPAQRRWVHWFCKTATDEDEAKLTALKTTREEVQAMIRPEVWSYGRPQQTRNETMTGG